MAKLTQEQIMQVLDALYSKMNNGVSKVSPPIEVMVDDYLKKMQIWKMQRNPS